MTNLRFDQPDSQPVLLLDKPGEYQIEIDAPGIELTIKGAFEATNQEQLHLTLTIIHQAPHTKSHTKLRGVASDSAQLHLSGTIVVEPAATNTDAFLDEKILLLTSTARAEAVPNLEIATNDVKCSHAATVSYISEDELFYLMSRGLDKATAQALIVQGFLSLS